MKAYVDNKDKMTSYQWGYDEESKRYFVKINFDVPSDTKANVLSLSDYTKQVRKEVCEKFVEQFMMEYTMGNEPVEDIIYNISERIQGE